MSLSAGTRLGSYVIEAPLGSGGMGDVYRARDTKLNRPVAIKVLSDRFAHDPARLQRLQREAQVLASLNHPQIATIHGLEESNGIHALVMELVEGEDLAQRIARGPIPLDEALALARQIAEALEAAHGQGIIHRDLKPANIKVKGPSGPTPTHLPDGRLAPARSGSDIAGGTVKVLDFGLAKALDPASSSSAALAASPTITSPAAMTAPGILLGTAAYMSPEQARGRAVDKRADIWAFGCVLYEMLAGRLAFPGETVSDTIAAILGRDPEWGALPADTPGPVRQLLRRCLDRDPNRRLHDIADARIEIEDARSSPRHDAPVAAPSVGSRARLLWGSGLALLTLVAAGSAGWFLHSAPAAPEARLEINTTPTTDASLAISPDGLKLVFVGRSGGQSQLWLRSLDSSSARPLPGTERASTPFWSADSRSIGFFADTKLKRMDIDGGSTGVLVTGTAVPLGGTWNREGTILYSDNPGGPVFRTSVDGATPVAVTRIRVPQERGHYRPLFLPDGRHFLFSVSGSPEARGVYVGSLDGADPKRLFDADGAAAYASTGHLLFSREKKLIAQRFDADRVELRGDPFVVDEHLAAGPVVVASAAGPIAYRTRPPDDGQRQLVWFDRTGRETDKVVYPGTAAQGPSISHDGRRIALYRFIDGNMDIWVYETSRRTWDRITSDAGDDIFPLWSPDDGSIAFGGVRNASEVSIYRKVLGTPPGSEELLLSNPMGGFPLDWSADGRFLLCNRLGPKTGPDIWALPLDGDRKPFEVVRTEFNESQAQFSRDGRWIVYQSDKTGREEIYLRPFPGPGADVRVSTEGGAQPRWNRNGNELFYVAADDKLMAVPIHVSLDGKTIEPGEPVALFTTNVGSTAVLKYRQQYVVSPDGQSFVMQSVTGQTNASPITVILNWKPNR